MRHVGVGANAWQQCKCLAVMQMFVSNANAWQQCKCLAHEGMLGSNVCWCRSQCLAAMHVGVEATVMQMLGCDAHSVLSCKLLDVWQMFDVSADACLTCMLA